MKMNPMLSSRENLVKSTLVIIPCFNESTVLKEVICELISKGFDIVVVDDCSNDDSAEILKYFSIHYIKHPINLGQGAALTTGFQYAQSLPHPYVVTFDADGQHNPNDIINLLDTLANNDYDIVFGSRFLNGTHKMPKMRKLVLKFGIIVNYLFTGILLSDAHNGLRAFKRTQLQSLNFSENRMAHATELLFIAKKYTMKYAECPTNTRYTDYSLKKGQRNISSINLFFDIFLFKLFRNAD
ncbi:glycosyltransferase family 2 protein [Pedobacter frigoris]|uniref:Glycosyltransferase family 2 protein n=1 Tax=Pedobacter frigoris TaxID=2571272 RepID=A0A4U1CP51_9SPHI|nr:glycosyltransferase family 2 protein [Pedobacter frigoris]TKC07184.1 glycosyltransferase family 2 protein [Pedobacter frigoris]